MSPDPLPLLTARTRLRRLAVADLAPFQAYRNDPETGRWQGWQPMEDSAASAFLQDVATSPFCTPGHWFQLGIAERDSDALIGDIGWRSDFDTTRAETVLGIKTRPVEETIVDCAKSLAERANS